MIPRIKSFTPTDDYLLLVTFDDGRIVRYDVMEDIRTIPAFQELETEHGLFQNAQFDQSRTCIYWNDQSELPSDTIYEYGTTLDGQYTIPNEDRTLNLAEDTAAYW